MRKSLLVLGVLLASVTAGTTQEATGDWLVKDKIAIIRLDQCDGLMWGVVVWEKEAGGLDRNNPDPAKRKRPTLGMPVLLGMKPALRNQWAGEIYNAQDGKTYTAKITLASSNLLRVEGCLLGFLCGGEDWTRVPANARPDNASGAGKRTAPPGTTGQPRGIEVCSRISELSGSPHQRRLK